MAAPSRTRRARRHWLVIGLLILLPLVLLSATALIALYRPADYRPASVDHRLLNDDKRDLVNLVDRISGALNAGEAITIVLDEQQVNRWIVARGHLWPDVTLDITPLEHPQVTLRPGVVKIAATLAQARWRAVLTLACAIETTPESVRIECVGAAIGALPLPIRWALRWSEAAIATNLPREYRVSSGRLSLPNRFRWPNGDRRFSVDSIAIVDGAVHIVLIP